MREKERERRRIEANTWEGKREGDGETIDFVVYIVLSRKKNVICNYCNRNIYYY